MSESLQAMACFRDLRTFMRAVFSSSLKSLAIKATCCYLLEMRIRDEECNFLDSVMAKDHYDGPRWVLHDKL
ncbi:hypothetical protein Tco_0380237 [Tanacetum coccineum]